MLLLLEEAAVNVFTTTILDLISASHSMSCRHFNTLEARVRHPIPLLEHWRQKSNHVRVSEKVLNQHLFVLCLKMVQSNRFHIDVGLSFGHASVLDHPLHVTLVNELLDY